MLRLFDKLGEWLLIGIKFVFLPRPVQRQTETLTNELPSTHNVKKKTNQQRRKALIKEAVSLHRKHQDALSELDDVSRKKLSVIAKRVLSIGDNRAENKHDEHDGLRSR